VQPPRATSHAVSWYCYTTNVQFFYRTKDRDGDESRDGLAVDVGVTGYKGCRTKAFRLSRCAASNPSLKLVFPGHSVIPLANSSIAASRWPRLNRATPNWYRPCRQTRMTCGKRTLRNHGSAIQQCATYGRVQRIQRQARLRVLNDVFVHAEGHEHGGPP
jgi:hypothetical protein